MLIDRVFTYGEQAVILAGLEVLAKDMPEDAELHGVEIHHLIHSVEVKILPVHNSMGLI